MLRYDEKREKIAFKATDREIRVFEVEEQKQDKSVIFNELVPPKSYITDFRLTSTMLVVAGTNFKVTFIDMEKKEIINEMKTEGIVSSVALALTDEANYLACAILQDLNIYQVYNDFKTIVLMRKFYCLHRGKNLRLFYHFLLNFEFSFVNFLNTFFFFFRFL